VTLRRATIGPNVSISAGAAIDGSTLRDTIVGANARITRCTLHDSLIGDDVVLEGFAGQATVGDDSDLRAE
jgi:glucose-1-phosphate thymidylyltransferase